MGYRHPDMLMAGMTARQFRELELFCGIEPIGEYREELRHGQKMAMTANINREAKSKAFEAKEFMNFVWKAPERVYTEAELEAYADRIFRSAG